MLQKIAIIGGGSFGLALSVLAAKKSFHVSLWLRDKDACEVINKRHLASSYLPGITIKSNVEATLDISKALADSKLVILAIPIQSLGEILKNIGRILTNDVVLISTAKGIEKDSSKWPYELIAEYLQKKIAKNACYLSGPSFANEIALNLPTAVTIASLSEESALFAKNSLKGENFAIDISKDIIGICICGALKNIYAIAAGIFLGLGLGKNASAALITRSLSEMVSLGQKMGAKKETFSGLCGIGDLVLSSTHEVSRNFKLGQLLAQGHLLNDALKSIGSVVEGVNTASSIPQLVKKYEVSLPICETIYYILFKNLSPSEAISSFFGKNF